MRVILAGGGAGINILTSHTVPSGVRGVGISTSDRAVSPGLGVEIFNTGIREIRSWYVSHTSLVKQVAQFLPNPVRDAILSEFLIYISALGGETGTAIADSLILLRRPMRLSTVCIFVLPFSAEKVRREKAFAEIKKFVSSFPCVVFDNDLLIRLIPDKSISKAMGVVNSLILEVAIFLSCSSSEGWKGFPAGWFIPIMGVKGSIERPFMDEGYTCGCDKVVHMFLPRGFGFRDQLLKTMHDRGYTIANEIETEKGDDLWLGLLPVRQDTPGPGNDA